MYSDIDIVGGEVFQPANVTTAFLWSTFARLGVLDKCTQGGGRRKEKKRQNIDTKIISRKKIVRLR